MADGYFAGWDIHPEVKQQLLRMCPPSHSRVRCEYVAMMLVKPWAALPPQAEIVIRGMFDDGVAQALVCMVNGAVTRPDGRLYHATISHVQGFEEMHTGILIENSPRLVNEIAPWPILAPRPFVRSL